MKVPIVSSTVSSTAYASGPSIEVLEARIAPAGVVNVSFSAGQLTVDSDGSDSGVHVFATESGAFRVEALAGSSLNGDELSYLDFVGAIKSITWNGNGGNDELWLTDISVKGSVALNGGDGDNWIQLTGVSAGGHLTVANGAGNDHVDFSGTFAIGGDVRLKNGEGGSVISAYDSEFLIGGSFTSEGSAGLDALYISGPTFSVGHDVSVDSGDGDGFAYFYVNTFQVNGNVTLRNGDQIGETAGHIIDTASGFVGGNLAIKDGVGESGQILDFGELTILGNLTIDTGDGPDGVQIGSDPNWQVYDSAHLTVGGNIRIDLGDGDNNLIVGLTTLDVAGHTTIRLGSGSDNVQFGYREDAVFELGKDFMVDLGDGLTNQFTTWIGRLAVDGSLILNGGEGDDSIAIFGQELLVARNWIADSGDGFDFLAAEGWTEVQIGSDVRVKTGESEDYVGFAGGILTLGGDLDVQVGGTDGGGRVAVEFGVWATIGGNVSVSASHQTEQMQEIDFTGGNSLQIGGNVNISGGQGDDYVWFRSHWTIAGDFDVDSSTGVDKVMWEYGDIHLGGSFRMTSAGLADFWSEAIGDVVGDVELNFGTGQNFVFIWSPLVIRGDLSYDSDTLAGDVEGLYLEYLRVEGSTQLRLGDADSEVWMEDVSFAGSFLLETAGGNDAVFIEQQWGTGHSTFEAATLISLGEGDDQLQIGHPLNHQLVEFLAQVIVDGAGGVDSVNDIAADNLFGPEATLQVFNV